MGCRRLAAQQGRAGSLWPGHPGRGISHGGFRAARRPAGAHQAIARHLTDFLKETDRFAKTIVFCVDQEHASEMRAALNNLNADLVGTGPSTIGTADGKFPLTPTLSPGERANPSQSPSKGGASSGA